MSASLVGSEMCIRDRSANPQSAQSFAIGAREARPKKDPRSSNFGISEWAACLLYTSDAADDM
eukprot:5703251-Alexandrium_andersonii.AAC.1